MSHDLNITWQMGHMYQHDLKSLFYVVLIFCCHYGKHVLSPGLRKLPGTRPFDQWFSGSCHVVHALQNAWITNHINIPVTTFFNGLSDYLSSLILIANGHLAKGTFETKVSYRSKTARNGWISCYI
ncbi:hypothetical protein K435DRAFT_59740 [Dendrothele bispora CBS 962.96]|uniref:Uncharacterized protein n=1 Tax=Dendrothele bispora (strain CBS 962.96) TaxID=1314807 RepID=A0A4S8M5R8_DENBC|nr:hypothetical protein K435DRAFT_59740 [Dendrothele bispora CBS 962.96]